MAKASKMNRGISSKKKINGKDIEYKLPVGVHSFDAHGNIFASFPELSRTMPRYFTLDELEEAWRWREVSTLTEEGLICLSEAIKALESEHGVKL